MKVKKVALEAAITIPLKKQYSNIKPSMQIEVEIEDMGNFDKELRHAKEQFFDAFEKYCATAALKGQGLLFNIDGALENDLAGQRSGTNKQGQRKGKKAQS